VPKRPAGKAVRTGIIHVTSLLVGVPVPAELQSLAYAAVLVEVGEMETTGLHAMLLKMLFNGVPMLFCGTPSDMAFVTQFLKHQAQDEQLTTLNINLYRPSKDGRYLFQAMQLLLVSKNPLTFRVCP
jgi:hypothetical protein